MPHREYRERGVQAGGGTRALRPTSLMMVRERKPSLAKAVLRARRPHPARMGPAITGTPTSLWDVRGFSGRTTAAHGPAAWPRPERLSRTAQ